MTIQFLPQCNAEEFAEWCRDVKSHITQRTSCIVYRAWDVSPRLPAAFAQLTNFGLWMDFGIIKSSKLNMEFSLKVMRP